MPDIENKQRQDAELLQKAKYHTQVLEMLERLGLPKDRIQDVEQNPAMPELVRAKELVNSLAGSQLFEKEENGQYNIYTKMTAITFMTASVGMMEDLNINRLGIPYYTGVSKWLNIPVETLRRWWATQSIIMREQTSLGYSAIQRITLKQIEIAESFTDGLLLTKAQIKELQKTPKGIAVMSKISQQAIFLAKLLTQEGEIISMVDKQKIVKEGEGTAHGVAIMMPMEINADFKVTGETDVSSITDNE